ncbi:TetR family transcriptional regulator [Arthrobacter gandavensis]|uniref:TetR family transcriptional regulator n=1 Tax=Arthrobacter gandavensis TaxID=169960 RepID=UPI00188DDCFA|nr:TetR family transcriptional regulator [Arthrobacter gandavensis]MBF4993991.1 TetR family transcriptional regulator [Arthrobacter gandavensis]
MTEQQISRRERNKTATRRAIADATLGLVRSKGAGQFTIDDIADAAGISRRTFFNYFPSATAALNVAMEDFLDGVLGHFQARPQDEDIVDSMLHALSQPADPANLAVMAELHGLAEQHPDMVRVRLEAWDHAEHRIVDSLRTRLGQETDPFYTSTLVAAVLACGRSAFTQWQQRTQGEITPQTLTLLEELFSEAIGFLRDGFSR